MSTPWAAPALWTAPHFWMMSEGSATVPATPGFWNTIQPLGQSVLAPHVAASVEAQTVTGVLRLTASLRARLRAVTKSFWVVVTRLLFVNCRKLGAETA